MEEQQAFPRSRSLLTKALILLNTLVLGGCLALLIVNRLLQNQRDVYVSAQSMAAASTILDFMEDLLPLYLLCGSALLLLLLVSATFWAWTKIQSRFWRYGIILLILIMLILLAGMWLLGGSSGPIPLQTTPTPPVSASLNSPQSEPRGGRLTLVQSIDRCDLLSYCV
jgi:hypothetical protein